MEAKRKPNVVAISRKSSKVIEKRISLHDLGFVTNENDDNGDEDPQETKLSSDSPQQSDKTPDANEETGRRNAKDLFRKLRKTTRAVYLFRVKQPKGLKSKRSSVVSLPPIDSGEIDVQTIEN